MSRRRRLLLAGVVALLVSGCWAAQADAFVYWSNAFANTIARANLDGSGVNGAFISNLSPAPAGFAVDGQHVYWTNDALGTIGRANLDGSGVNQSFITGADDPEAVAVDGQHIYWANFAGASIGRANLDGTGVNQSFISINANPAGLAVDGQHIYWSDDFNKSIGRANLDGSGVNLTFISGVSTPEGVAVDGQHVYWADINADSIGRANLDGSGVNDSFITGASAPDGVAVDGQHIYWTNHVVGSIGRANLDGTGVSQNFIVTGASQPSGIGVDALGLPTASITAPVGGATFSVGQVVDSSFTCEEGQGGPGLASCVDQAGKVSGSALDTSTPGSHTLTVTATSGDGLAGTASVSYTVAAAPTVSITTPASAATFAVGQVVDSSFSCSEGASGPGIESCVDQNGQASGAALDTATTGSHTLRVTATSTDGQTASATVTYTVAAAPTALIVTPVAGARFAVGQVVDSSFSCSEGASGPGLASCVDQDGKVSGSALDTSTPGSHTLTVTATSKDGQTATKSVSFTVAAPPTASIATPASAATFAVGQVVDSSFSCSEGASGPGIKSCVDQNGQASGAALDTATTGSHTLRVTATSTDGQTASATVTYTVAAAPTALIVTPVAGARFAVGQVVDSSFSCSEGASGPGLASCVDQDGKVSGSALDTSTPGSHTLTVTATSKDGQTATKSVSFTVAAPPTASIATPASAATFAVGQVVDSSFSCSEGASGPGIKSCVDQNGQASGAALDTATTGSHTLRVTATSTDGQTASATVTYTVAAAPTALIVTPVAGARFAVGQVVDSSFSCSEGASGPGLASCVDQDGDPAGTAINTATPGSNTFTVIALSSDGQIATAHVTYRVVAGAPSAQITTPAQGAMFTVGQIVDAAFSCRDGVDGPGIATCAGPVPNGAPIDTATIGAHTFTVTATSSDGQTQTTSTTYMVRASAPGTAPPPAIPVLTGLKGSHARWRAGTAPARISSRARAKPTPVGTTFSFSVNVSAKVTLVFSHKSAGRRVKRSCVAPTTHNAKLPRCARTVRAGTMSLNAASGADRITFDGRIGARKLKPGRYTMTITAANTAGSSKPRSLTFTIIK